MAFLPGAGAFLAGAMYSFGAPMAYLVGSMASFGGSMAVPGASMRGLPGAWQD